MITPQSEAATHVFKGAHGDRMAFHDMGPADGRPVILIHGLFSNAQVNWIKFGHAAKLAAKGRRVIMPDLRAHGESARSYDTADYTADILADDNLGLVEQLGFGPGEYDLGCYSLGGRTTARISAVGNAGTLANVFGAAAISDVPGGALVSWRRVRSIVTSG